MNNNKQNFGRSNSICPTPQSILLHFVKTNDTRNIRRLVSTNPVLLSYIYRADYNKPILLIACTEPGIKPETVQTLIDLGANVRYASDVDEDWEAIHFAAHATNSAILEVIVNKLSQLGRINALAKGNNAFHILIKYGRSDLEDEFLKCANILITSGIDVNQGDEKNKTVIFLAAKKKYKSIIKLLLDNPLLNIDLDSKDARGETARNIIETHNLYDGTLPGKFNNNYDYGRVLFAYLKSENENGFLNFKDGDIQKLDLDIEDGNSTLLQYCSEKGLTNAAEHLLNKGADPNRRSEKNSKYPIEIAAERGYYEVLNLLLDHPQISIPKKILIYLLKNIDNDKFPKKDHEKCYDLLVAKLNVNNNLSDVNFVDESSNSALHYAVRYAEPEKTEDLLKLNASLASKNIYGVMPIQDIDPELLEKHLDNCVEFNFKSKSIEKEDFAVTFNYRTLVPPVPKKSFCNTEFDLDTKCEPSTDDFVREMEVIYYMSRAAEYKHLLKHPVIVSFLFMKWHRIRWLFYINLAFYITFFASLVTYIFTSFANFSDEPKSSLATFFSVLSYTLFFITFFGLVMRELFQIAVSSRKYLKNFENYIELILICVTAMILFSVSPSNDLRKQLSSLAILLSAFELVLMVGQHPKLSTNVVMLKTVSFNFFKFLLWYSLLIIAFALSFYILFTSDKPDDKTEVTNSTNTDEEAEEDLFKDPGKSVFKTIIMLTGEFDASDLNFQTFPILSKLIFALFIFMIAIILLNLLNGLAVSDTQMIKNDAELVGHIARAQHVYYVESMLLGNIFPVKLMNFFQNFCCCIPNFELIRARPLAKRSCLFPYVLNYEMTVYPNKQGEIALPKTTRNRRLILNSCATCSKIYLDKETVRRTNAIVQQKRDELKIKAQNTYMDKIENMLKIQQLNMDKLDFIIENLLNDKFEEHIFAS